MTTSSGNTNSVSGGDGGAGANTSGSTDASSNGAISMTSGISSSVEQV